MTSFITLLLMSNIELNWLKWDELSHGGWTVAWGMNWWPTPAWLLITVTCNDFLSSNPCLIAQGIELISSVSQLQINPVLDSSTFNQTVSHVKSRHITPNPTPPHHKFWVSFCLLFLVANQITDGDCGRDMQLKNSQR